ncbi:MAG: hypothetical protein SF162_09950 [bacterium]|nr:hypothetical protein [bacterium]
MPDSSFPPPEFQDDGAGDDNPSGSGQSGSGLPSGSMPPGSGQPGDPPPFSNAFDAFVNKDLDMSGLENGDPASRTGGEPVDKSYLRPLNPFPFPTPKRDEDSPFGSLPGQRFSAPGGDDDIPPRLTSRLLGTLPPTPQIPRVAPPSLEDPRWVRGVYRVQRDLRIYRNPHRAAPKLCTLPEANRRIDKTLRFIPNFAPGWSAVHLGGDQPIIGFVDNSEVYLIARRGLRDVWETVALMACLILLVLALAANLDQLPFFGGGDQARITELEQTVAEQQARIDELEAALAQLQSTREENAR